MLSRRGEALRRLLRWVLLFLRYLHGRLQRKEGLYLSFEDCRQLHRSSSLPMIAEVVTCVLAVAVAVVQLDSG